IAPHITTLVRSGGDPVCLDYLLVPPPAGPTLFPYTTLFRSIAAQIEVGEGSAVTQAWFMGMNPKLDDQSPARILRAGNVDTLARSAEHTSELQSRENLVCRLLLEKKR